uniref:RNA polymerase I-specific transcription initiation factor RRN3 n=1 Tax=Ditylenchus dipsaci TaxID=166011 RepID=A0A915CKZ6_9BILA
MMSATSRRQQKEDPVTGREIIKSYINVKPLAIAKYHQLHKALDLFDTWDEDSKVGFLAQFLDMEDILDANCTEIVAQFCRLKWHTIPTSIRPKFVDFLASQFLPELKMDLAAPSTASCVKSMVPILSKEKQEEIYSLAHHCIKQIMTCCPAYLSTLVRCCKSAFPHFRHLLAKMLAFMRNLILLSEEFPVISAQLWSLIIDRLIYLDTSISSAKKQCDNDGPGFYDTEDIFMMDEEEEDLSPSQITPATICNVDSNSFETKLDLYINFSWIFTKSKGSSNIFNAMLAGFDEHVLYAYDLHSVSYLWLYLCSLSTANSNQMLNYLWNIIRIPVRSPNEWKKTHNAASFICAFLARSSFIPMEIACVWLRRMADWCCSYINNCETLRTTIGGIQHGTFYAVVQSLLFVFCYRYKELADQGAIDDVHQWGLGRIVHSKLEPLRFISQAVALCFANVSRYLQIVYCNHILSPDETLRHRPVELYFPFSFCMLNICAPKILPLMRKFTPAEDDSSPVPSLKNKAFKDGFEEEEEEDMEEENSNDYDFMASL